MSHSPWTCALELKADRSVAGGSHAALCDAIRRGADLRVYTEFLYEEHIAPFSKTAGRSPENDGIIREVIDFRETFLVDDHYVAGITTLRQPMEATTGFNGTQPRMSYFLYNMNASQACASLILDGSAVTGAVGTRTLHPSPPGVPKMSAEEVFDADTHAPSRNFIYDMEVYRFWVSDTWSEILANDERGRVTFGSFAAIEKAQREGREIKVGIRDLCAELGTGLTHEVFTLLGSGIVHTGRQFYEAQTQPLVRVRPAIPLRYASRNWDVVWAIVRTNGAAVLRTLDPYTRRFADHETRLACRWFVR